MAKKLKNIAEIMMNKSEEHMMDEKTMKKNMKKSKGTKKK